MEYLSWDWLVYLVWLSGIALIVVGLAGTVLPGLPGPPIMLAGMLLMAWLDDFAAVGWGSVLLLTLLAVLSVVIDFLATAEGARRSGAGWHAMLGASIGLLVGLFFGLPGLLLGPFIGGIIGHQMSKADLDASVKAGVGASIGVVVGTLAKVGIGMLMLAWFVLAWFW
jgi:hypothetical protein